MNEQLTTLSPAEQARQDLMDKVNAAHEAAAAKFAVRTIETGGATDEITRRESIGDVVNGPFLQKVSQVGNTVNNAGVVQAEEVNGHMTKTDENGIMTRTDFNTAGVTHPTTGETVYARTITAGGAETLHTDPAVAHELGAMVAEHVAAAQEIGAITEAVPQPPAPQEQIAA